MTATPPGVRTGEAAHCEGAPETSGVWGSRAWHRGSKNLAVSSQPDIGEPLWRLTLRASASCSSVCVM